MAIGGGRWWCQRKACPRGRRKCRFILPSMLPLLSSPCDGFFPLARWALCPMVGIGLAASCSVGANRLQRPSIRAGSNTRHPILYASWDESGKSCRRRPHLSDGFFERPGSLPGRLHQHLDRGAPPRWQLAEASLSAAPSGNSPVSKNRHRAISHLRATATIPMRLTRFPPAPKRSLNQQLRTLSGC
jgi:hypothetical protein